MTTVDRFAAFCRVHHGTPGFSGALMREFGGILPGEKPPLIWFEANACSGDSISTLNTVDPELGQILCSMFQIRFWNALMPGQGRRAVEDLFVTVDAGGFVLVVEGAVATAGRGKFAIPFKSENHYFTSLELIQRIVPKAKYVVAAGTCATFGGPSAARPNPSGSAGLWEIVDPRLVINVSGCPVNPDWLTGTLFHLLAFGPPEVDRYQRPTLFYGQTVHSICQRRSYFDTGSFAVRLGDPKCMFSLGCMGPVTGADCPYRLWNEHLNWPVKANTPCIGCTKAGFPDKSTPFYTPLPDKMPRRAHDAPANVSALDYPRKPLSEYFSDV